MLKSEQQNKEKKGILRRIILLWRIIQVLRWPSRHNTLARNKGVFGYRFESRSEENSRCCLILEELDDLLEVAQANTVLRVADVDFLAQGAELGTEVGFAT